VSRHWRRPQWGQQRDENERHLVNWALAHGYSVDRVDGKPYDLVVGKRGRSCLVECKLPAGPKGGTSHSGLNKGQRLFKKTWKGCYHVVRTPEGLLKSLAACREASDE
jgi:hypothetical protein